LAEYGSDGKTTVQMKMRQKSTIGKAAAGVLGSVSMRMVIIVSLGLASALDAMAQAAPPPAGETNTPDHAVSGQAHEEKHVLEPGDIISFQIVEDKKPATNLVVTDSSEVHVPILGRVDVAGKTCLEVAVDLKALFEKDYYYHATVVVGLDMMNRTKVEKVEKVLGQVLIWGEVRNPGSVNILSGHTLTISEAILRAGGLTDSADKKNVKIIRSVGHGTPRTIPANLHEIMDKGKTEKDVAVEPNDYIIVGSRLIRF
jgi:protein involved in polysaccharide export with SLBB domain